MKAVILAGGLGTRISEETHLRPKPMIEIGGKPILWHIMKTYSQYGINDFIVCLGYKGYLIKEYFANYYLHMSNVTFNMQNNSMKVHQNTAEPWSVTLLDTGETTGTGGRLKQAAPYLDENEPFCFTYGDGLSNINISNLVSFYKSSHVLATVTAVQPPGRFGVLNLSNEKVSTFHEKPQGDGSWINGGYFVLSPKIFDYIDDNNESVWENRPLQKLAHDGQLSAFKHDGFWQPMDTLRDKVLLDRLWETGDAPWKTW